MDPYDHQTTAHLRPVFLPCSVFPVSTNGDPGQEPKCRFVHGARSVQNIANRFLLLGAYMVHNLAGYSFNSVYCGGGPSRGIPIRQASIPWQNGTESCEYHPFHHADNSGGDGVPRIARATGNCELRTSRFL